MNSDDISRRDALKALGVAGALGLGSGVVSGHGDDVDRRRLNELRRATARYHDLDTALADGFVLPEDHCVSSGDPNVGAMGFHYVHPGRLDEALDHTEPEVLVYEQRGNNRHLVAVEFLSTATAQADGGARRRFSATRWRRLPSRSRTGRSTRGSGSTTPADSSLTSIRTSRVPSETSVTPSRDTPD